MYGVVIIALGHGLYAKFAYNSALSLFNSNKNIPITIITEESCISEIGERIDDLKKIGVSFVYVNTDECLIDGVKNYQLFKLKVYDLSPYDTTLYLDADTIINPHKDVGDIFGKCVNRDFQTLCAAVWHAGDKRLHGKKYTHWGKQDEIIRYHKLTFPYFYQTQSSAVLFTKSEQVKKLYKTAHEIYLDRSLPCIKWAGGYPDEYCFNVALNILEMQMIYPFTPIHGVNTNGDIISYNNFKERFYGMQVAGTSFKQDAHKVYNMAADIAFNTLQANNMLRDVRPYPLSELEKKVIDVRKRF
jgi:alpha-N-acetylglucosamine transferase